MFKVGQQVRFVGRAKEKENYHNDYKQLLGKIGTVRERVDWSLIIAPDTYYYEVEFEGLSWEGSEDNTSSPANWFTCLHSELEAA